MDHHQQNKHFWMLWKTNNTHLITGYYCLSLVWTFWRRANFTHWFEHEMWLLQRVISTYKLIGHKTESEHNLIWFNRFWFKSYHFKWNGMEDNNFEIEKQFFEWRSTSSSSNGYRTKLNVDFQLCTHISLVFLLNWTHWWLEHSFVRWNSFGIGFGFGLLP